jgi:hypothetical protein
MDPLSTELARSPERLPHSWDAVHDAVLLTRMTEAAYAEASFLDGRILRPDAPGEWVPFARLGQAVGALPERLDWIFHIGHVGSTLLARLVGARPDTLALREPAALRSAAQLRVELDGFESALSPQAFEQRLGVLLRLWSRTWRPDQTALVKATSFASEFADELLARPGAGPAVLMYAPPEVYLASILAGPNSRVENRTMAPSRLKRLHRRLAGPAWRLWELSEGETVAMAWAAEAAGLAAAARRDRTLKLDFDRLLAAPEATLAAVFKHLGKAASEAEVRALVESPIMRRYAKAPEHAYDAALRRDVLAQGRGEHGAEIRKGLAWLERAAAEHGVVREAVEAFGG